MNTQPKRQIKRRSDLYYMGRALHWARKAGSCGEVPIGAVVVAPDGEILGRGYNRRETRQDVSEHAELMALRQAMRRLGSWRLDGCTLYVSLEPCFMCASAIQQARIQRVVYAAADPKAGALGSLVQLYSSFPQNHQPELEAGLLAAEASELIRTFFRRRRQENRQLERLLGGRSKRRQLRQQGEMQHSQNQASPAQAAQDDADSQP